MADGDTLDTIRAKWTRTTSAPTDETTFAI